MPTLDPAVLFFLLGLAAGGMVLERLWAPTTTPSPRR